MKRRCWKLWVAGIALAQLLVIGIDVALLWPEPPSEAEEVATQFHEGMTEGQWRKATGDMRKGHIVLSCSFRGDTEEWYRFDDGSRLRVYYSGAFGGEVVTSVHPSKARPVPPLTRLRRTLTRLIPALKD